MLDSSNFRWERGVESEVNQWRWETVNYFWGEKDADADTDADADADADIDAEDADADDADNVENDTGDNIGMKRKKKKNIPDWTSTGRASPF